MLSEELRRLRVASGLSTRALGAKLGVSGAYVSKLENDGTPSVSFEFAAKLCKEFALPLDHFQPFLAPGVTVPPPPTSASKPNYMIEHFDQAKVRMIPDYGVVAAGSAIDPDAEAGKMYPAYDLPKGDFFTLTVKGDSMIDAGVNSGDRIIVRKTPVADDGEEVVADLEGQLTLKTFRAAGRGGRWLEHQDGSERINLLGREDYVRILGVLAYVLQTRAKPRKRKR